jgi:dUTP pyrophosphatase
MRLLAREDHGVAEESDIDVRATGMEHSVTQCDEGSAGDEQRDERDPHASADEEGDRGVERCEHERGHGRHDRGAHENPERRPEPLSILRADADIARCLLHYPRWVTETVDVPIIAPDVPIYAHPGDAGADLVAAEALRLEPGRRALVGTGVSIALPDGYAAFVVPRSGLAAKHGITVVNSPGTVDAGYRGEIKVTLLNTDAEAAYDIGIGDRIAQLIVMPVTRARFIPVETLPESVRGDGGFGSTGYHGGSA